MRFALFTAILHRVTSLCCALAVLWVGDSAQGQSVVDVGSTDFVAGDLPSAFYHLVPGHLNLYVFRKYECSELYMRPEKRAVLL